MADRGCRRTRKGWLRCGASARRWPVAEQRQGDRPHVGLQTLRQALQEAGDALSRLEREAAVLRAQLDAAHRERRAAREAGQRAGAERDRAVPERDRLKALQDARAVVPELERSRFSLLEWDS